MKVFYIEEMYVEIPEEFDAEDMSIPDLLQYCVDEMKSGNINESMFRIIDKFEYGENERIDDIYDEIKEKGNIISHGGLEIIGKE